ncbi:Asp23/Gls24 family envelope stress response protein [Natronosporangium hydrolyticum]|uniref:Asp23/Gls24 family envelope stress response protein n=1 Tax=Natronosporangium hydrolyticum TaxID=2811111 RepID=A0A895YDR8_9ACTN|nr:Asp23/Gls24 family envelope stress response protein [Natronosporangium hydrolyticum]QSB15917.1 Asp23/Gls24 family envelope stress response protein [Natronosporangium hydrolyticum]
MTDPTPDGPTNPQLTALPPEDATTLVSPVSQSPGGLPVVPPPPGSPAATSPAEPLAPTMTASSAEPLAPTMTALPPEPPGRVYGTGERRYDGGSDGSGGPASGPAETGPAESGLVASGPAGEEPPAGPAETAPPRPGGDRGKTTIAEDVIEQIIDKIVNLTVVEVGGVRGLHSDEGQPVAVTLDGDQAEISISVRVAFGYAVHDLVEQLRSGVIEQVERLLGLTVTEVNVLVADVTFDVED